MYKKSIGLLVLGSFAFMFCFLCVREADAARLYSEPVQRLKLELWELEEKAQGMEEAYVMEEAKGVEGNPAVGTYLLADREQCGLGIVGVAVSGQRVVDYVVLEQRYVYELSDDDLGTLLRIVEAEAGNEDEDGKLLVANVVLNRVNSEKFPGTVSEVVFQREKGVSQFSPVSNGSFYRVEISDETITAVGRALMGEDISQGALYFAARKYANSKKMKWFDENLTYLFEHGGHEFFK